MGIWQNLIHISISFKQDVYKTIEEMEKKNDFKLTVMAQMINYLENWQKEFQQQTETVDKLENKASMTKHTGIWNYKQLSVRRKWETP